MEIKQISRNESNILEEIVDIHATVLRESFLTNFKRKFLHILYSNLISSPETILLVAMDKGKVAGFALAVTDYSKFIKNALSARLFEAGVLVLIHSVLHPQVLYKLLLSLPHLLFGKASKNAELQFIALQPEFQGQKIGEALLHRLAMEFHSRSITHYLVSTKFDNTRSNNFYIKNGFTFSHVVKYFGEKLNYYISPDTSRYL
jgi:ribosomal protein S18 acetylase RimI-like enzyme